MRNLKSRPRLIVAGLVGLVLVIGLAGAAGWYLLSPLFIDNVVEEAFPVVQAPEAEASASQTGSEQMEAEVEEVSAAVSESEEMSANSELMSEEAEMMAEDSEMEDMAESAEMEAGEAMPEEKMEAMAAESEKEDPAESAEMEAEEAMAEESEKEDMAESAEMEAEEAMAEENMAEMEEESTESGQPVAVLQGEFQDGDRFHQGSGQATIYRLADGSHVLRFEDFEVTNGPDLHVLLSTHPAPTNREEVMAGYLDLGELKGNIGSQNYDIPAGTDLAQFNSVVIYCEPFHVVFSTATLGS